MDALYAFDCTFLTMDGHDFSIPRSDIVSTDASLEAVQISVRNKPEAVAVNSNLCMSLIYQTLLWR